MASLALVLFVGAAIVLGAIAWAAVAWLRRMTSRETAGVFLEKFEVEFERRGEPEAVEKLRKLREIRDLRASVRSVQVEAEPAIFVRSPVSSRPAAARPAPRKRGSRTRPQDVTIALGAARGPLAALRAAEALRALEPLPALQAMPARAPLQARPPLAAP